MGPWLEWMPRGCWKSCAPNTFQGCAAWFWPTRHPTGSAISAAFRLPEADRNASQPDAGLAAWPAGNLNRELSWIAFNQRVLAEASNRRHPLLERVRFLAISDSNLDEFLMVRLAGVQAAVRSGCFEAGPDGRAPSQQLTEIRQAVRLFLLDQRRALHELLPLLMTEGMEIVDWDTVPVSKQARLRRWIADRLAPACRIVTLRARPRYPFVSGLTGNLAVALRYSRNRPRLAVLNVPPEAPRLLAIASSRPNRLQRYVWLEDALQAALPDIFPHAAVESACTFRLLRNADFEVHNINAHNLVEKVLLGISRREHGEPVALQVEAGIDCDLRDMLARNLQLDSKDVYPIDGPFGLAGLSQLAQAQQPRLQYSPP